MQHFGAPTRLLDFTHSLYVAAYFAIENASEQPCAVWAIDSEWFHQHSGTVLEYQGDQLGNVYRHIPLYLSLVTSGTALGIFPVDVSKSNERSLLQQGVFVVQGDISKSFEENLVPYPQKELSKRVVKINISAGCRREALADLFSMNLHRGTLFPGLGGFAQSLGYRLIGSPELLATSN